MASASASNGNNSNNSEKFIIVDGRGPSNPQRRAPAKLFHKKSRTGCQLCRARRVKCNEAKPTCHHCQRLGQPCVYDRERAESDLENESPDRDDASSIGRTSHVPLVESDARRRLEIKLLTHYLTTPGATIALDEASREIWGNIACRMALDCDALLYSIYLLSSFHMAKQGSISDAESTAADNAYLDMATSLHHRDVSQMNEKNADLICMTSSMLRAVSYTKLQSRSLDPYTPPIEWLRIGQASSFCFKDAWDAVNGNPQSITVKLMQNMHRILTGKAGNGFINELQHLTQRELPHELAESWDREVSDAYESTVDFIGGIWKSRHEPEGVYSRQLVVFPMLVHSRFVELVEEKRPRALVILAHYFALLTTMRALWWIGDTGFREIGAIYDAVPAEWRAHMGWPMQIIKGDSSLPANDG